MSKQNSLFLCCYLLIIVLSSIWTTVNVLWPCPVYPEKELLDHKTVPFLVFWGNSILFCTAAAPVCIPTNIVVLGSLFLCIFSSTYCLLICVWWPFWLEWSYISLWFLFAFLWWLVMLSIFSYICWPSLCGEVSVRVFAQFFNWIFFGVEFYKSFIHFGC